MKTQLYSFLKFVLGGPLTVLALFFIIKIIVDHSATLLPHFTNLNPLLLLCGIFCFVVFYFVRSYLWYRILRLYQYDIDFKSSSYLWSISEIKRYIPGNVWSFLGRAVLFGKKGIDKKDIGKGLIIEAELFIFGCLIVSLLSLPLFFQQNTSTFSLLFAIGIALIVGIYSFNRYVYARLPNKLRSIMHFISPPFSPKDSLFLIGVSVVALLFFGMGNYFIMTAAVGTNPQQFPQLVGMFVLAFVVGYLSFLTPAGFGVREGVILFGLNGIVSVGLAAFIALFSRIILIFSELLFIGLSYLWFSLKYPIIILGERWIARHARESILFILCCIYILYFTVVSFLRYDNYYTGRFDLGNMAQTVWNTLHGNIFVFTNPNGTEPISRLAFHADFILVLLAPLYALWQDPRMLLLIQTVVLASGAFFVYYIGKTVIKSKNLSFVFAFAYLINPSIQRSNLYDFHPVTLATTFLLATYYFYLKKKYWQFILFAVLAALCKEQIWLILGLFGILVFFHHKKRILGASLCIVGISMFYYLLWFAIPHTLGTQHFALAYYSDLGDSPSKIVRSLLLHPQKILQAIDASEQSHYLYQLFAPLGYLSFVFPFFIIFAGPDLLINLLSNNTQLHQIYYQYTATITPFLFLSAIYGVWALKKISIFRNIYKKVDATFLLGAYIFVWALYSAYSFGPLPGSQEANVDMFTKPLPNRSYVDTVLAQIPPKAIIAASNNLGSHLSQRERIYVTPLGIDKADMILIEHTDPQAKATTAKVEKDSRYRKIIDKDGFVVFEKK